MATKIYSILPFAITAFVALGAIADDTATTPVKCPNFAGIFVAKTATLIIREEIAQTDCLTVTTHSTTTNIASGQVTSDNTFVTIADNVARPTKNPNQIQYAYFTDELLVSIARFQNVIGNIVQVEWSLDDQGNKVLNRYTYDSNEKPIGNPYVLVYYRQAATTSN